MNDYVLISFYNTGTTVKPIWNVVGHKSLGDNDVLKWFDLKSQAIEYAHGFLDIPVVSGQGARLDGIIERLSRKA